MNPLIKAGIETSNTLPLNSAVIVKGKVGSVEADHVILAATPTFYEIKEDKDAPRRCLKNIFTAFENGVPQKSINDRRIIAIPVFSTNLGKMTSKEMITHIYKASLAFLTEEGKTEDRKDIEVRVLIFDSSNKIADQAIFDALKLANKHERIVSTTGRIESFGVDAIVAPLRPNWNLQDSGATAQAIAKAAVTPMKPRTVTTSAELSINNDTKQPIPEKSFVDKLFDFFS